MQTPRDSFLPLLVALLIAVAGHVVLIPCLLVAMEAHRWWSRQSDSSLPLRELADERVELGRPLTQAARIAWIPYEDARDLLAPHASRTEQPALQSRVEPTPGAPLELDPTPPAPSSAEAADQPAPAEMPAPSTLTTPPRVAGELPPASETEAPFQQPRAAQAARDESARPTSAPRSDREADLAALTETVHRVSPGEVLTAGGLEIKPARPDFSAIARASAAPRNPVVAITFAPDGEVLEARLLRDTGEVNVDAPILRSLYRWRAAGETLEALDSPITLRFHFLLMDTGE